MTPRERTQTLLGAVCDRFGISLAQLLGPQRFAHYTHPRRVAWRLLRRRGWSYPRIGALFDRHHTAIMYGCRRSMRTWARCSSQYVDGRRLNRFQKLGTKTSVSGLSP